MVGIDFVNEFRPRRPCTESPFAEAARRESASVNLRAQVSGERLCSKRDEAEKQALAYMATMPAWRGHPKVVAGRGKGEA